MKKPRRERLSPRLGMTAVTRAETRAPGRMEEMLETEVSCVKLTLEVRDSLSGAATEATHAGLSDSLGLNGKLAVPAVLGHVLHHALDKRADLELVVAANRLELEEPIERVESKVNGVTVVFDGLDGSGDGLRRYSKGNHQFSTGQFRAGRELTKPFSRSTLAKPSLTILGSSEHSTLLDSLSAESLGFQPSSVSGFDSPCVYTLVTRAPYQSPTVKSSSSDGTSASASSSSSSEAESSAEADRRAVRREEMEVRGTWA